MEDNGGLEAHVAPHFGRAPFFMIVDLQDGRVENVKAEPNSCEHFGGQGHPHDKRLVLNPDVIVAQGMGPGGLQSFRNAGVQVLQTGAGKVKDVVEAFQKGKLVELVSGCEHSHHH